MNEGFFHIEETVTQTVARAFADMYGFPEAIEKAEALGLLGKENGLVEGYFMMMEVVDHLLVIRGNPKH